MSKQIHYNIDNILKENATYNIIYGEKSNGKSYQVKHKCGIEHYLKTGMRFILMRRWVSDISNQWVEKYFDDVDVRKLTDDKYDCITAYRKEIFLSKYNIEKGHAIRGEKIGYIMALSTEQHYSGGSYLDCDVIIFEEFMERGLYIAKEPMKMQAFYSTVDRKRGETKVFMVGNTVSRVCPYLEDWGLSRIMRRQKQGTIETIDMTDEDGNIVKIALEYCMSSGGKSMSFGKYQSFIDKGEWQADVQPKLENYKDYKTFYIIGFQYAGFKFIGRAMLDKTKNVIWRIEPFTKSFKPNTFIFSDEIKPSKYWNSDIYNVCVPNVRLHKLLNTFRESNIFYSDDLTGTDFKQAINFTIRK